MGFNLFQFVSFIIALSAFIKVFFGVFFHERFYKWVQYHYSRKTRTLPVNLLLLYALILFGLVWYATLFAYVQYGWILTAILTAASVKSLNILFNWESTASKFDNFINAAGKKLWFIDLFVAVLGIVFLLLGMYVY